MQVIVDELKKTEKTSFVPGGYNKETNDILKNLDLVDQLQKFIPPNYLLEPKIDVRIQNLKGARKFFITINNKRGESIINNLLGNIAYKDQDYEQAVKLYQKALKCMVDLESIIIIQEEEESKLSDKEIEKLRLKTGKTSPG